MQNITRSLCATSMVCLAGTVSVQAQESFTPLQVQALLDASYIVGSAEQPELIVPLPAISMVGMTQPVRRSRVYKGICGPEGAPASIAQLYQHAFEDLGGVNSRGAGFSSAGVSPKFNFQYDTASGQDTPVQMFVPACLDAAFYIGSVMDNRVNVDVSLEAVAFNNSDGTPNINTIGTAGSSLYTLSISEYTEALFWRSGLSNDEIASWLGATVPVMFQGDAGPTLATEVTITQAQMRAIFGDNAIVSATSDVSIIFNTRVDFEFGPCGQTPAPDATSLVTTAVHELTHSLGFRSGISGPPNSGTPTQSNNPDRDLTSLDLLRFRISDVPELPIDLSTSIRIGQGFFNEMHWYVNPLNPVTANGGDAGTVFVTFLESGDDNQPSHLANTPNIPGYSGVMEPELASGETLCPEFYTPADFQPLDDMGWTMRFYERNNDCNGNGISDSIDIAFGNSIDSDNDRVPDECEFFEQASMPEVGSVQGVTVSVYNMNGPQLDLSFWNPSIGVLDERFRLNDFDADVVLPNDGSGRIIVMEAKIYAPEDDEYAFRLACPDQSELYINGNLIMAEYNDGSKITYAANDPNASSQLAKQAFVQLRRGYHDIQIRVNTVGDGNPDHVSLMRESFNLGGWEVVPSSDLRTVGLEDCNGNDVDDRFEIGLFDCDNNDVLDQCEYPSIADAIDLGVVSGAGFISLSTEGSSFDTEVFLWDANGDYLSGSDDCGSDLWSCIGLNLSEGEYFLAVAGYNSEPTRDFGVTHFDDCTFGGNLFLDIEGTIDERFLPAGNHLFYRFVVADGDCDGDTIPDSQELDCDNNGVADECEVATPGIAAFVGAVGTSDAIIDFNTFGTGFDTEIAVWDSQGRLLDTNDDANGSLQSQILIQLPPGIFYVAFAGYDHEFSDDFGITPVDCSAGGNFNASVGSWSGVGGIGSGRSAMLSFEILPGDCDGDGVPDDLELDCDQDGFPDSCQRPTIADAEPIGFIGQAGEQLTFATLGSSFDTEIAIWNAAGNLLASNDDAVPGSILQSQIDIQLTQGLYYLSLSGYNTVFGEGFGVDIVNCSEGGMFVLDAGSVNLTGQLGAGRGMFYAFEVAPPPCPADLNQDGVLNFFDVSAFLTAYSNEDPAVDFDGNGQFNFFDVSAFLTSYGTGCP